MSNQETYYYHHGLFVSVLNGEGTAVYDVPSSNFYTGIAQQVIELLSQAALTAEQVSFKLGHALEDTSALIKQLHDKKIVMPDDQEFPDWLDVRDPEFLEVYLEITRKCNLHCFGCATDASPAHTEQLSNEQLIQAVRLSLESARTKGMKRLKLKLAGGEPSLPGAFKEVKKLQEHMPLLKTDFPEIEIEQVLLTNGTLLTEEKVELLKQWNMRVSVSLWGIGEQNSSMRGMKKSTRQFENIIDGLKQLHEKEIKVNINHVVTPDNASLFPDFIRALWDPDSDVYIAKGWYNQPLHLGVNFLRPQNSVQLKALTEGDGYQKMFEGIQEAFIVIDELLDRGIIVSSLDWDYLQLNNVVQAACGTGFNYMAVGSGKNNEMVVASCHESMRHKTASVIGSSTIDILDTANSACEQSTNLLGPNVAQRFSGLVSRPIQAMLALHGGTGCPHDPSRAVVWLYEKILPDLLRLELKRRELFFSQATKHN